MSERVDEKLAQHERYLSGEISYQQLHPTPETPPQHSSTMTLKRALKRGEAAWRRTTLDACALEVLADEVHRLRGKLDYYREREEAVKALRQAAEVLEYDNVDSLTEKLQRLASAAQALRDFDLR